MNGLNLHDIVRPIITFVNPDEDAKLYKAVGQKNTLGVIKPLYEAPIDVKIQFQPESPEALRQVERISDTKIDAQVFMYSDSDLPVSGIQRLPVARTGDFLQRDDGQYYLITSVSGDWSRRGWIKLTVTLQLDPPDFSACEWYPMPLAEGE